MSYKKNLFPISQEQNQGGDKREGPPIFSLSASGILELSLASAQARVYPKEIRPQKQIDLCHVPHKNFQIHLIFPPPLVLQVTPSSAPISISPQPSIGQHQELSHGPESRDVKRRSCVWPLDVY
jgi:hypothetical protein